VFIHFFGGPCLLKKQ